MTYRWDFGREHERCVSSLPFGRWNKDTLGVKLAAINLAFATLDLKSTLYIGDAARWQYPLKLVIEME